MEQQTPSELARDSELPEEAPTPTDAEDWNYDDAPPIGPGALVGPDGIRVSAGGKLAFTELDSGRGVCTVAAWPAL